jgi:hypothetical protein
LLLGGQPDPADATDQAPTDADDAVVDEQWTAP